MALSPKDRHHATLADAARGGFASFIEVVRSAALEHIATLSLD